MDKHEDQITSLPRSKQIVKYCHDLVRVPQIARGRVEEKLPEKDFFFELSAQFYSAVRFNSYVYPLANRTCVFGSRMNAELPVGRPKCHSKRHRRADGVSKLDFLAGKNLSLLKYHTARFRPLGITFQT